MIEVEIAVSGETLPQAISEVVGDDNQPYEVDVVVDFSMTPNPVSTVTPGQVNHLNKPHNQTAHAPVSDGEHHEDPTALDDAEKMSDYSENWAEDRFQKVTDAEKQVS
jgi:hypothetical protein